MGTITSSYTTSAKSLSPVAWMIGRRVMPGVSSGTSNAEIPRCAGASGSVRTRSMQCVAHMPIDVQTLVPFTTKWSSSSTAWQRRLGEVAARVGFAEPLAPHLVGAEDALEVHLLLGRSRRRDRGTDVLGAEHRDPSRCLGPTELGVARDLVLDAQRAPADLDRPRGGRPAACAELALELEQSVPLVGVAPALAMTRDDLVEDGAELQVRLHRRTVISVVTRSA